jgi:hypothetical protein
LTYFLASEIFLGKANIEILFRWFKHFGLQFSKGLIIRNLKI